MNGSDFHRLDVFIGSDRKIATITIPVGSDTDISWVYEPSWLKDGFCVFRFVRPPVPVSSGQAFRCDPASMI